MNTDTFTLPTRTRHFIDYKVSETLHKGGINYQDSEDLRQEMCLAAVIASGRYDPSRGARIETLLEKAAMDGWKKFFRSRMQLKRSCLRLTLDEPVKSCTGYDGGGSETEVGRKVDFLLDENEIGQLDADRRMDIEACLKRLNGIDREAFKLILDHTPFKDIPGILGTTEAKFRFGIVPRITRILNAFAAS